MDKTFKITVLGSGAFGKAMAYVASHNLENKIVIWGRNPDQINTINQGNLGDACMEDSSLTERISATIDLEKAMENTDLIIGCLPVQITPKFLTANKALFEKSINAPFVCCSKGMVVSEEKFIGQCAEEIFQGKMRYCILSGPSFGEEMMKKYPTCVVIASKDNAAAALAQKALSSKYFRPYTQNDVIGVEIAGALKNVVAIGAGIIEGLGYGYNTIAALITRGTREMQKFAKFFTADPITLVGLSGIGDIMLTGFGKLSRNRTFGYRIGKGETIDHIIKTSKGVVEGLPTMEVVVKYSKNHHIDMPIFEVIYKLTYGRITLDEALEALMLRELEPEYPEVIDNSK